MEGISIVLMALGLSMDAFAVSITSGIFIKKVMLRHALKIAIYFGVFQGVMPLIGWLAGFTFKDYIERMDHWIAFVLLGFLGVKMIMEAIKEGDCEDNMNPMNNKTLLMMAIATSIDALAVGISFAVLQVPVLFPAFIIALITFIMCFIGVFLGEKFGCSLQRNAQIIGGIILVLIGTKILAEHTSFIINFTSLIK